MLPRSCTRPRNSGSCMTKPPCLLVHITTAGVDRDGAPILRSLHRFQSPLAPFVSPSTAAATSRACCRHWRKQKKGRRKCGLRSKGLAGRSACLPECLFAHRLVFVGEEELLFPERRLQIVQPGRLRVEAGEEGPLHPVRIAALDEAQ